MGTIVTHAVADLGGGGGFQWVPWNPSFEGLPSKILCANILQLRTLDVPALELHKLKRRFYSRIAPSAARDGDMLSV